MCYEKDEGEIPQNIYFLQLQYNDTSCSLPNKKNVQFVKCQALEHIF